MKPIAIHFGTGALGRGLVVPYLHESGFDVITVDTDRALALQLKKNQGYDISLTDTGETRHIPVNDVLHPDDDMLQHWLNKASLITTSVRKENLHHVARLLRAVSPKTVICCENIEQSGAFFASLLEQEGIVAEGWHLPDCMVDRICASLWPASLLIETESWGTVCVQAQEGALIPEKFEITENIDFRFQEKRILVNTYADGISFLGAAAGLEYLYEAAESASIDADIADYMAVLKDYLKQECGYDPDYLNRMAKKHRNRLSNPKIKREIGSVARSFLEKIRPTERFIYPLIVLQNKGVNIDRAIPFLNKLINSWASLQRDDAHSRQQALEIIDNKEIVEKLGT
ncbi:Mannitol dehydrogenase C-domain subfamily [Sodalis praecaptivus]|uniref:Mannitol dehydrogenase C-domain subfamily n=1 Tax=Sodalis praecaptivus TaxID=1239307 RepID=W0HW94_9GAMM|nr:mannitol dehydrogenase [Sodalis praecaptivus]AHF78131.1 Mannitol dehydrogenase C-domain subfamily [Sodalis praecaptivus]